MGRSHASRPQNFTELSMVSGDRQGVLAGAGEGPEPRGPEIHPSVAWEAGDEPGLGVV